MLRMVPIARTIVQAEMNSFRCGKRMILGWINSSDLRHFVPGIEKFLAAGTRTGLIFLPNIIDG